MVAHIDNIFILTSCYEIRMSPRICLQSQICRKLLVAGGGWKHQNHTVAVWKVERFCDERRTVF